LREQWKGKALFEKERKRREKRIRCQMSEFGGRARPKVEIEEVFYE